MRGDKGFNNWENKGFRLGLMIDLLFFLFFFSFSFSLGKRRRVMDMIIQGSFFDDLSPPLLILSICALLFDSFTRH